MYTCGIETGTELVFSVNGNAWTVNGTTLGTANLKKSDPWAGYVTKLDWPACLGWNINAKCPNAKDIRWAPVIRQRVAAVRGRLARRARRARPAPALPAAAPRPAHQPLHPSPNPTFPTLTTPYLQPPQQLCVLLLQPRHQRLGPAAQGQRGQLHALPPEPIPVLRLERHALWRLGVTRASPARAPRRWRRPPAEGRLLEVGTPPGAARPRARRSRPRPLLMRAAGCA